MATEAQSPAGSHAVRPVGVAVIGVGMMGEFHARVLSEISDARLVAIADVDGERARSAAERYGVAAWTTEYETLLERDDVDAVWICTQDHLHRDIAVASAQAGKAVFVEKPLATTLDDADAIIAAVEQAAVPFMVGHIYRFEVHYAKLRQAVASGNMGDTLSYYGRQNTTLGDGLYVGGRVSINMYLSVHGFDLMAWILGREPESVYSLPVHGKVFEECGVADGVWSLVRFEDGAAGCDEVFWTLSDKWADYTTPEGWGVFFNTGDCRAEILGTTGSAYLEFPPTVARMIDAGGWKFAETKIAALLNGHVVGALREEVQHFCSCVRDGLEPVISAREARRAVQMSLAAERSSASGEPVLLSTVS